MLILRVVAMVVVALSLLSAGVAATTSQLKSISLATATLNTRLLLDLSAPAKSSYSLDANHRQLRVHLDRTVLAARLKQPPKTHPLVETIAADTDKQGTTIRLDLKKPVKAHWFTTREGHRYVFQLSEEPTEALKETKANPPQAAAARAVKSVSHSQGKSAAKRKERVIVIDAGHGGKDTGAIGPGGVREKDVVLAIAQKLAHMIRAEPGMRAVLTRNTDRFIALSQRADVARVARADLFVSLHADAFANADARGSSVFTLSENGASSVAAGWLADRENSADLVGGVKLRDKGKVLASVLLDLSQKATIVDSDRAATRILNELQKSQHLHHSAVQKAGFVVLKSPDVPSLLVETAFISNPEEEKNLVDGKYQEQLARAIFWGIHSYFDSRYRDRAADPAIKSAARSGEVVAQE